MAVDSLLRTSAAESSAKYFLGEKLGSSELADCEPSGQIAVIMMTLYGMLRSS